MFTVGSWSKADIICIDWNDIVQNRSEKNAAGLFPGLMPIWKIFKHFTVFSNTFHVSTLRERACKTEKSH